MPAVTRKVTKKKRVLSPTELQQRQRLAAWIKSELQIAGETQSDLAKHLGIQQSQLTRLLQSKRGLDIFELERIEAFFGGSSLRDVPLVGLVGETVWRDAAPENLGAVHGITGGRSLVPLDLQKAYQLKADSLDGFFKSGDLIFVVGMEHIIKGLRRPGDVYVTVRKRGGDLFQFSLGRADESGDPKQLQPMFAHSTSADSTTAVGCVFALVRDFGKLADWGELPF